MASRRGGFALLMLISVMTGCTIDTRPLASALSANPSATAVLEGACGANVRAVAVPGTPAPPPAGIAAVLQLPAGEVAGYRHVRLMCGDTVLSDAHNWYVASRLTAEMNAELAAGERPFGKVAGSLGFTRELIDEADGREAPCPPGTVLSHRAMLRLPDGRPLALLTECYTRAAAQALLSAG